MADYRDPKVTTTTTQKTGARGGMGRWIGILVAVIVILLLIAWWWGGFGGYEEAAVEPVVPAVEGEAVPVEPVEPVAPAGEGEAVPVEPVEPATPPVQQ